MNDREPQEVLSNVVRYRNKAGRDFGKQRGRPASRRSRARKSGSTIAMAAIWGIFIAGAVGIYHLRESSGFDRATALFQAPASDTLSASFAICSGTIRMNCVVDGDTFWFRGEKIRIADIDTPELSPPRCAREKQVGEAAKHRLYTMLNAGSFSLLAGWRDEDQYGRKLRTVYRDGLSIGTILVGEGLARRWEVSRRGWCD